MSPTPVDLAALQRARLRAQADVFATIASHGTIVGTAREIALIEFVRGLVPRRFEVLTGSVAQMRAGKIEKASSQLDVLVVDTFEFPTILRSGDLAIALPESVRVVVESKSDLKKGQEFFDALQQIGEARVLTSSSTLTVLFCFGAPADSSTLRGWLAEVAEYRKNLEKWAAETTGVEAKDDTKTPPTAAVEAAEGGTARPERYKVASRERLIEVAGTFSSANLPDLILADKGAIAFRVDATSKSVEDENEIAALPVRYEFFETKDKAPSVVALASKVLAHTFTPGAVLTEGFKLLVDHYQSALEPSGAASYLDISDPPPVEGD